MLAVSQLAIMDFNGGSNLEQAVTENGEKQHNMQFSKITKSWSSKRSKKNKVFYIRWLKRLSNVPSERNILKSQLFPIFLKHCFNPKTWKKYHRPKPTFTIWK